MKLSSFVATTEREENAKAIMKQKNSIEAKRVLATDTSGSISEGNVGEFLKYLPGVLIDDVEADARSVSLGGLDPKYTSVTLGGSPIACSGHAAAGGAGVNRAFEFDQISINGIEAVELSRAPQPRIPEAPWRENNDTETARVTSLSFRDSPKPSIRYNGNVRVDYNVSEALWFSARAESDRYHAKFFSRWAAYKTYQANSQAWVPPTEAQMVGFKLQMRAMTKSRSTRFISRR